MQPTNQWVPGVPSPEVKLPGHEAHHSPESTVKVKNVQSYTSKFQLSFLEKDMENM
jgi:hypothetical protein